MNPICPQCGHSLSQATCSNCGYQTAETAQAATAPLTTPTALAGAPATVNLPVAANGLDIRIDNVNRSLWQYARQHDQLGLLLVPVVVAWEWLMVQVIVQGRVSGNGIGYGLALPFILLSAWYYRLKKKFEAAFLQQFAAANGFGFEQHGTVDETYGSIFRLPGRHAVSDVVTGSYQGYDLRLFLHDLTVQAGRSSVTYNTTVIELDLKGQLPAMLLMAKRKLRGGPDLQSGFGQNHVISLEGDFDQRFVLKSSEQNEVSAREVFSPDTMAIMEDEATSYDVEFAGNRIYIYSNGYIGTTAALQAAFALAKQLAAKLGPLAGRMAGESDMVVAPVNITTQRSTNRWGLILLIPFVIMIVFSLVVMIIVMVGAR